MPEPASRAATGWRAVLDRLEADLAADTASVRSGNRLAREPWEPPPELGPFPAELEERARRIAEAQHSVIGRLRQEQQAVSRHLGALHAVPATLDRAHPVYLDTTG